MISRARKRWLLTAFRRWQPWLVTAFVLFVVGLMYEALHGLMRELSYAALVKAVGDTQPTAIALALAATALSYAALTGYDHASLRFVGVAVPYRIVARTAFIAYALANTVGLGVVTGGAVRMRMYGAAGVEAGAISRAIAFNAAAFGIGITTVGAVALLWGAHAVAPIAHVPVLALQAIAAATVLATAALIGLCFRGSMPAWRNGIALRLPTGPLAIEQLLVSTVDIVASAAVLWCLLPAGAIGFPAFVGFFAIATVLGIISHVPGGLGVFEAVMLVALGGAVPTDRLAGALLLYRLTYHVLPLLLALALLIASELRRDTVAPVTRAVVSLSPVLLAAQTLIVGVFLLATGVTPATISASDLLSLDVPLPLVEAAHFLGSIAGLALLFVARGMLQRLDAAWWAGLLLAGTSLLLALPRGLSVQEAIVISLLVAALALSRSQFTRRTSLLAQRYSGGWLAAIAGILVALGGLLLFAYRDIDYRHELWWQFELDGHAPRALRAMVAMSLIVLIFSLRLLLRPALPVLIRPDAAALAKAAGVIADQDYADAGLALTGDKPLLFSESGKAFIMFGRRGRSWVALFDPVGPREEWPELVWAFIERARETASRPAFYQVRPQHLAVYLDAGLNLFKLGEEAQVSLPTFSLNGGSRAHLRAGFRRAEREGLRFEVIPVDRLRPLMPELRAISDAWLGSHAAAEKGFSLGQFDETYLCRQPVAVIRKGDTAVAFASLLTTGRKVEASIDLMRHLPDAPKGAMDFLFAHLLLHFKAEGYQRFSLGMAPLSGMSDHALASNWHRFGGLVFEHGEHFYNFQGLRAFKEKFDPVWEPRYLASPGSGPPLLVLRDVAMLISGGLVRAFSK